MSFISGSWHRVLTILFYLLLPVFALADGHDTTCDPNDGKICNPIGTDTVQEFIEVLLEGVLKIGIPLVALAIIYCGFLFVTAIGNSEKIKKAREALVYTLIGAAILLGSWAIAELLNETVEALK